MAIKQRESEKLGVLMIDFNSVVREGLQQEMCLLPGLEVSVRNLRENLTSGL